MATKVPKHWRDNTWEEKAKENPLLAIMTTEQMIDEPATDFSEESKRIFFEKGQALFDYHVKPLLERCSGSPAEIMVVEYGCGAGRILRAVADAGYRCAGIDISQTMLDHCHRYVPEAEELSVLGESRRCLMPDAFASVVYSYAVVQHISSLADYITAFDEMCRILRPGGILAVQVNCNDFESGYFGAPFRTENYEDHSLHFRGTEGASPERHSQDQWSGVYIGHDRLAEILAERNVYLERWYYHNQKKLRAVWAIARKLR